MNPPFGAASLGSKAYIERAYPRTKNDLYAAFVERGLELLRPGGYLGAITSRTGFFLTSFQKWREEILLQGSAPGRPGGFGVRGAGYGDGGDGGVCVTKIHYFIVKEKSHAYLHSSARSGRPNDNYLC